MSGAASGAFSDVTNELKYTYPDGSLEPVVNLEASYRKTLKKDREAGGASMNKQGVVTFEARLSEAQNISMIADGADIMPVDTIDPEVVQCQITPTLFFATVTVGLKTKWIAKDKQATFNEGGILGQRMEGATKSLGNLMDRMYAGAQRGAIGVVESDGSNTIVLAKPMGIQLVKKKDPIDVYTAITSGSVRDSLSARRITAINRSTRTITYSGADQTAVAGDYVFIASAYTESPLGLPVILDDGTNSSTYCGVTRSSNPGINAIVLKNGGDLRPLSEDLLLQLADEPRQAAGSYIDRILCNTGQGRMFTRFVAADRRFISNVSSSDGAPQYTVGYRPQNLKFFAPGVEATVETHVNIQPRFMYGINSSTFRLYNAKDIGVLDDAPGMGMQLVPTTAGHKARVVVYVGACENQYNLQPGFNAVLGDLIDPLCGDDVVN